MVARRDLKKAGDLDKHSNQETIASSMTLKLKLRWCYNKTRTLGSTKR